MTGTTDDAMTLLSAALDQTGAIIVGVRDDQQHLPTPCRSWDVATLVAHVVHDLSLFTQRASGGTPDWTAPPPTIDGEDAPLYDRLAGFFGHRHGWTPASAQPRMKRTRQLSGPRSR